MNVAKEFVQFSQNAHDETVRILWRYRDTDSGQVIGSNETHAKNDDLQALAVARGVTNWDENDCCTLAGLTMPPIPPASEN